MTLVVAVAAHAPTMALMHAATFSLAERWGPNEIAAQIALPGVHGLMCLHPVPSKLVDLGGGFILYRVAADEAEVLTLAVSPAFQRRGLGRRLLHAALDCARDLGAVVIFLEVASDNIPALSLYAGASFTQVGCRRGYYPDGSDALVLRRDLTPGEEAGGAIRPAEA